MHTISTGLLTWSVLIISSFALLLSVFSVWRQMRSENIVRRCVEFVETENKNAVSLRRMAEVEITLTELTDSYTALLSSHKKLRSRITMRDVRERKKNGDATPESGPTGTETAKLSTTSDKEALRALARSQGRLP